jgi:hypothetical protein
MKDANLIKQNVTSATACKGAFFQPKHTVNQPNDIYEQEADAVADKVMRMPNPGYNDSSFFKPAPAIVQRKCQHCEEEEKVHRKESTSAEVRGSNRLDSYVGSLGTSGQPLPESSRQFFEPRFGQDFSNVRLHTDSVAAKSAQSINALAYTTGNNIVFNSGQYSPDSDSGKKLMAHELTHVVQQKSAANGQIQRAMAPCPAHLEDADPVPAGWRLYPGPTSVFHCGFRTILENRAPTPAEPMNECVYDHSGVLVTDSHPFAGCKGTPDQYDASAGIGSAIAHSTIDSGGIVRQGLPAFITSRIYGISSSISRGIEAVASGLQATADVVGGIFGAIANSMGSLVAQGILSARAICDPVNWTYTDVPDRSRRHLNMIGMIISSISLSGGIDILFQNLTKPLGLFPIAGLITEMAADISSVLTARGEAPISAVDIGHLSLYQFVEWLVLKRMISYNRPPEDIAAEDLRRLLHP